MADGLMRGIIARTFIKNGGFTLDRQGYNSISVPLHKKPLLNIELTKYVWKHCSMGHIGFHAKLAAVAASFIL